MAKNSIPALVDPLIVMAADAADGAEQHEATLPLVLNTEAGLRADLSALAGDPANPLAAPGAQALWLAAKSNKTARTALKQMADSNAKAFIASAINVLKPRLGGQWNSAWQAVGFSNGSLALPRNEDGRYAMLGSLKGYLTANPTHENAPLGVTATLALAMQTASAAARQASHNSNAQSGAARAARDAAAETLRKRLRSLIDELDLILSDDDPRWYAFGLNAPGDPEMPAVPDNVVLTAGPAGSGTILVDWDDARRADRYHVHTQTAADPDPVHRATPHDSDATLTLLPSDQPVTITITALNEAGESLPSVPVTMVVP